MPKATNTPTTGALTPEPDAALSNKTTGKRAGAPASRSDRVDGGKAPSTAGGVSRAALKAATPLEAQLVDTATAPSDSKVKATVEFAATLNFEPMSADVVKALPTREDFMTSAGYAYASLVIGADMLTKSTGELVAAFRAADDGDGAMAVGLLDEVEGMRKWFADFASFLEVVQARMIVAASHMALGTAQ